MKIAIINGPNLNRLGRRQPEIYGSVSFDDYLASLRREFPDVVIDYYQSNCEGMIIDRIQEYSDDPLVDGIIINPGAYAHYSYAIADAIADAGKDVIEVHISDIHSREEFRRTSVTAVACREMIAGKGLDGYKTALKHLIEA